jgi:hypothetical protein
MTDKPHPYSLDRTALVITSVADAPNDTHFWMSKSPSERLAALEFMRQTMYGYNPITTRLQRVLTVTQRSAG